MRVLKVSSVHSQGFLGGMRFFWRQQNARTSLNWRFIEQLIHFRAAGVLLLLFSVWTLSAFAHALGYTLWQKWQGELLVLSVVLLAVAAVFLWLDYVKPSRNLRAWLLDIHAGDLSSRVSEVAGSSFNGLCRDFNSMAHMLEAQSAHGNVQVQRHTEHLTDKTRMQERAWIAYELHDSLAQTIGGMRFQAHVLEESLQNGDMKLSREQLEKLGSTLRTANREIRDLIGYFHATSRMGSLEHSVDRLILKFRNDNPKTRLFFHKTWSRQPMPQEYEVQVLRIIQEALNNVQKHARATLVRVMVRGSEDGHYRVLIEDNGVGMRGVSGDSGEHVGLDGMRNRALWIDGRLTIESELGEGVHIALDFSVPTHRAQGEAQAADA